MDLGKLLFMGYVSKEEQEKMIDKIIFSFECEYSELKALQESINAEEERAVFENYLLTDAEYFNRIKGLHECEDITQNIREISKFTLTALDYGIETVAFNIEWFKKLKKRL